MRRLVGLLAVLTLVVAGCGSGGNDAEDRSCNLCDANGDQTVRVAAVGDSNTTPYFGWSWCNELQVRHQAIDWRCHGLGGARMIGDTLPYHAGFMLTAVLAEQPDVVLLALGTNDAFLDAASPDAMLAALQILTTRIEDAGAVAIPALVPPLPNLGAAINARIDDYNALVLAAYPQAIDFHTGMGDPALMDGVHFYVEGMKARADRAEAVLW
jgi:lysophospholipase L1-like esterase